MNQPVSSCLTHFQELINIASTLQTRATTVQSTDHGIQPESQPEGSCESFLPMDTTEDTLPPADCHKAERHWIKQHHPTAGEVFGQGTTFMDHFDSDGFASARSQGYLYYPFATRGEWELASFLLRSQFSLADIDHFLKLELVSLYFVMHIFY
jgi:hypothetical protein